MARQNIVAIICLFLLALLGIKSLHLFAATNGLFDFFGEAIDKRVLPGGVPLEPLTTNGWSPAIDWQLRATTVFFWPFVGDGSHPDTTLSGLVFVGAWASSWVLIVLESLRSSNKWRLISYDSIIGILIFNHAHGVMTPLYLALHLFTSPTAVDPTHEGIKVNPVDLKVIPLSFIVGLVFPVTAASLPAPSCVSVVFKQTVMAWYQQWNIYIAIIHFVLAAVLRRMGSLSKSSGYVVQLYVVYAFAFALAAIPYWILMVISSTAAIWPGLFAAGVSEMLHPAQMLLSTSPWSGVKAKDLAQGFLWLIQWDYLVGTWAVLLWASILYHKVSDERSISSLLSRIALYTFWGGPAGAAVCLMWKRDELLLCARHPKRADPNEYAALLIPEQ